MAKPAGDHTPLSDFVLRLERRETTLSQERISRFVFAALVFSTCAFWFWFLFTHADKVFFKH
jgi:hypothetical protein